MSKRLTIIIIIIIIVKHYELDIIYEHVLKQVKMVNTKMLWIFKLNCKNKKLAYLCQFERLQIYAFVRILIKHPILFKNTFDI